MLISISNRLPKTSYMKMVDVWLLFNLIFPFLTVFLHTYMDTLRSNEDFHDDRENTSENINGKIKTKNRKLESLEYAKKFSLLHMPVCNLFFASLYWIIGLKQAEAF